MRYSVPGNKGVASVRTIVAVRADATTPQRGRVLDYMVGSISTPADSAFDHTIYRVTTAGTGAAVTLVAKDPADAVALADGIDTVTVDPTITAATNLLRFALNQRATFRWVAAPGDELVWPATASNGIGGGLAAATTTDFSAEMSVDTA